MPRAGSITRAADRSVAWSDPRNVKHEHRTDRIDVHIVEERVERATCERHVLTRLFSAFASSIWLNSAIMVFRSVSTRLVAALIVASCNAPFKSRLARLGYLQELNLVRILGKH